MLRKIVLANQTEAKDYLKSIAAQGYDTFRGQRRDWPILPSLLRGSEQDKTLANNRLTHFLEWCSCLWRLSAYDKVQVTAIAQHYGIPTNLIDATRSVDAALFFAQQRNVRGPGRPTVFAWKRESVEGLPQVRVVDQHVPDLWRLEAQDGLFLEFESETPLDLDLTETYQIMFASTCTTKSIAGSRETFYPARKSRLEVVIDDYFRGEMLEKRHAEIKELARTDPRISQVQRYRAIRGYQLAFVQENIAPSIKDSDRQLAMTWLERNPLSYTVLKNRESKTFMLTSSCSDIRAEINRAVTYFDSSRGYPTFELVLYTDRTINTVLTKAFNWLFDGLIAFPFTRKSRCNSLVNSFQFLKSMRGDRDFVQIMRTVNRVLGQNCLVDFAPEASFRRRAYASISSLECAINLDALRSLLPFFRKHVADKKRAVSCFEVRPAFSFNLSRFVVLFAEEVIPSQVLEYAELCKASGWCDQPPWNVVFDPLSLLYFTVGDYKGYPFGYEEDIDNTVYLFRGMSSHDVQDQIRALARVVAARQDSNVMLRLHGFSHDAREIWEIDEAIDLLTHFYQSGGVRLLTAFTMIKRSKAENHEGGDQGNSARESINSDCVFLPDVYRAGRALGAFEVWLMVQRKWLAVIRDPEQDLRPLLKSFFIDLVTTCETAIQQLLAS